MPLLHRLLPPLALALLPGCIVPIPLPPGTPGAIEVVLDEGDSCGARGLQQFVGQDRSVVEGTPIQGPGPVRILAPGDVIGSDQDPTRANVRLDSSGKVAVVDCG